MKKYLNNDTNPPSISIASLNMSVDKTALVTFPEYPHPCTHIDFKMANGTFQLTPENLKLDPCAELTKLCRFLGSDDVDGECVLFFTTNNQLHIANNGDYISVKHKETEIVYWDNQEFKDEGAATDILGAIGGALITDH